ncbi:unnamed protein product [Cercopithifilaria johnstoni]|uniref:Uncharacterized protein n=1 Tax=Cercopithifilaria johnstoni TaxID=2874296 RepID=A0A8J2MDC4_9BILA|nr:unnamed protein product [Cercopithifilaria johnstoni]
MEKKKARKSRKKKSILNGKKGKEELNSEGSKCSTAVQNSQKATEEITEAEAKQNDNEFSDETKLSNEAEVLHFVLTNSYADNDDQTCLQEIEEAEIHHQEKCSSPSFPNCVAISSDENDKGKRDLVGNNWMIEGTSQERNVNENNSKSNLIEIHDEMKSIKASETANSSETETIDFEKSNSSDVRDETTSNIAESLVTDDLRTTDQNTPKIHNVENIQYTKVSETQIPEILSVEIPKVDFLANRNSNNMDEELGEKDRNLNTITNKTEDDVVERTLKHTSSINIQDSRTGIVVDTTKTEAKIEVSDFAVGNQNVDAENTEKIEQPESQEVEERNGNTKESEKDEFEASADVVNLSVSCTTESLRQTDKSLIPDEVGRSAEDPVVRNEVISETLIDDGTQKLSSPEIPEESSERIDSTEPVTINWQHDSGKESQAKENLSENESKIIYDIELLKNSEESNSGETVQPKNKFYEAIAGFWKHAGFTKKRPETTVSSEQSRNLSSELKQMSSIHSSKTSLTESSTESLGTLMPSSELIKFSEISSEPTTKVTVPHSEANVISSFLINTAADTISGCCPQKTLLDNQSLRNSLNITADNLNPDTISEALQVVTPDSLNITDETINDMDDSSEKMEDSKKYKKGKAESRSVFGHKVYFLLFSTKFSFLSIVKVIYHTIHSRTLFLERNTIAITIPV